LSLKQLTPFRSVFKTPRSERRTRTEKYKFTLYMDFSCSLQAFEKPERTCKGVL